MAVTLVDRRNHHLFQPLLYQVATGALSPGEIAQPLRSIFRKQRNTTVLLGEATGIDPDAPRGRGSTDGLNLPYDTLIVATGARHSYFGHDEWAPFAPGLKTIDDATEIRRRILIAFEAAEREADPTRRREWMTFVVVGGGPTGVELAGALGEIANDTLRSDFRSIRPQDARIDARRGRSTASCRCTRPTGRRPRAAQLERLGVDRPHADTRRGHRRARTSAWSDEHGAETIRDPDRPVGGGRARVVRSGGPWPRPSGAETDRSGRILVGPDLDDPGPPRDPRRRRRGRAAVEGRHGRCRASRRAASRAASTPAGWCWRGSTASRSRRSATRTAATWPSSGGCAGVTNIGWLGPFGRQGGFIAWALWLGIHIVYLIGFANRIVVSVRWAWSFLTRGRSTRLITGTPRGAADRAPGAAGVRRQSQGPRSRSPPAIRRATCLSPRTPPSGAPPRRRAGGRRRPRGPRAAGAGR